MWYPLHVIMSILGVPESDEGLMLKLTQELFGGNDPELKRKEEDPGVSTNTIMEFFNYFNNMTAERRAHPGEDLASVIANGKIKGEPLGDLESASYYIIVATAGHDTTSASISGGLRALIENPDELAKLKANPELLPTAVDEMIRWVTPVQHFMRTATEDHRAARQDDQEGRSGAAALHVRQPRRGAVCRSRSASRSTARTNRHVAFGYGAHVCLGQHLAKMEIRAFFAELSETPRPHRTRRRHRSARIRCLSSGLKTLPVKYSLRAT